MAAETKSNLSPEEFVAYIEDIGVNMLIAGLYKFTPDEVAISFTKYGIFHVKDEDFKCNGEDITAARELLDGHMLTKFDPSTYMENRMIARYIEFVENGFQDWQGLPNQDATDVAVEELLMRHGILKEYV